MQKLFHKLIIQFFYNRDGVAAVEMAVIAPFAFSAMLLAANTALQVHEHQKLASAAYATANYFQDQSAAGDLAGLVETLDQKSGEKTDGQMVATAKLIFEDAYGNPIDTGSLSIKSYCACPKSRPDLAHGFDESDSFYATKGISSDVSGNVCIASCPDSTAARIVAEIKISYLSTDLFGKKKTIEERLVTRLR